MHKTRVALIPAVFLTLAALVTLLLVDHRSDQERKALGTEPSAEPAQPRLDDIGRFGEIPQKVTVPSTDPKPLVDPGDIISGGPPPDGIPPLDDPKFQPTADVGWLDDREPVIVLELRSDARAYPLQIMTWHEIVNDEVGGFPVVVTFCPLCNTPFAFERPQIEEKVTTFGTSGRLLHSNLVMYDRATNSLWPQAMGQAVVGPLTGIELRRHPVQIVSWSEFRSAFPEGKVLSRDTGFDRDYGENPYPGYDQVGSPPFMFSGEVDGRLAAIERVLGLEVRAEQMAFPYFASSKRRETGSRLSTRKLSDTRYS